MLHLPCHILLNVAQAPSPVSICASTGGNRISIKPQYIWVFSRICGRGVGKMRRSNIKISRKEAKECGYWRDLMDVQEGQKQMRMRLKQESVELMKIFAAILKKSE